MALRSRFLELPVEIRQEIYGYIFVWPDFPAHNTGSKAIHAAYEAKARPLKLICGVCRLDFHKYRDSFVDRAIDTRADYHLQLFRYHSASPRDPTPILRTCRQVYFEAIDCLYNKTLFVFGGRYSASRWQPKTSPWRFIGTTTDVDKGVGGGSAFLKRITNVSITHSIQSGQRGQAVETFLLLLNDLLSALRPDRRFTELVLQFRVWMMWSEETNEWVRC